MDEKDHNALLEQLAQSSAIVFNNNNNFNKSDFTVDIKQESQVSIPDFPYPKLEQSQNIHPYQV